MSRISVVILCNSGAGKIRHSIEELYEREELSNIEMDSLTVSSITDTGIIMQLAGDRSGMFTDGCEAVTFDTVEGFDPAVILTGIQGTFGLIRISLLQNDSITSFDFANCKGTDVYEEVFYEITGRYMQGADGVIFLLDHIREEADAR